MIQLSDKAIKAIKESTKLKGQLQATLDISSNTLYSWLKKNDQKLTTASAIEVIKDQTGMAYIDILTASPNPIKP